MDAHDPKHGGSRRPRKVATWSRRPPCGVASYDMSTNTSRPDKSDGTDLPECGQTIFERIKEAIRGPDAKCGNGPAAVIAYAERQTTADFVEAADALERMIDCGDVVRVDDRLEVVETDGGQDRKRARDRIVAAVLEGRRPSDQLRDAIQEERS
jgi:hypothetical protein